MTEKDLYGLTALAGRLDLATEASSLLRGDRDVELPGIREEKTTKNQVVIHRVEVFNEEGSRLLQKAMGNYLTFELPDMENEEIIADIAEAVSGELKTMLPDLQDKLLLVVGLGNREAVPDALGPRTVEHTYPTRILFQAKEPPTDLAAVCTVTPGVMAASGLESAQIIQGMCRQFQPAAVIIVDSLASASVTRVGRTIQMSDSGINPGRGVGNPRAGIDAALCGCPVIALGIPTVVDTAAIINETIGTLRSFWQEKGVAVPLLDDESCEYSERKLLEMFHGRLLVTPQDIDDLIRRDAMLLAATIAMAVHPGANRNNFHDFIQ